MTIPMFHVLQAGMLRRDPDGRILEARSSVTLVCVGNSNILVDTGLPGDELKILNNLSRAGLLPHDINVVINTHGHPDHSGGNKLFGKARVICGREGLLGQDTEAHHAGTGVRPGKDGEVEIDRNVSLVQTPGHTRDCISVILREISSAFSEKPETVIIAGDALPTRANYVKWVPPAIHFNRTVSLQSMSKIVEIADWVIPGHDEPFKVN